MHTVAAAARGNVVMEAGGGTIGGTIEVMGGTIEVMGGTIGAMIDMMTAFRGEAGHHTGNHQHVPGFYDRAMKTGPFL